MTIQTKSLDPRSDVVLTPFGYRPSDRIISVSPDHVVGRAEGKWHTRIPSGITFDVTLPARAGSIALISPWASYGEVSCGFGDPVEHFASTWIVPPLPQNDTDQTIYLFNSLQSVVNNVPAYILQPVLLFGSYPTGNGELRSNGAWLAASFWVPADTSEPVFVSASPVQVNPGDKLIGEIILGKVGGSTGGWSYTSSFRGLPGTILQMEDLPPLELCDVVLEMYGVTSVNQLPPTPHTTFSEIEVQLRSGVHQNKLFAGGQYPATSTLGADGTGTVSITYPS